MRIRELITETVADDNLINQVARSVADSIIENFSFTVKRAGEYFAQGQKTANLGSLAKFSRELLSAQDPAAQALGRTFLYVAQPTAHENWQAVAYPPEGDRSFGLIYLNWKFFQEAIENNDPESLRWWLVEKLTHEMRHILDGIKQQGPNRQSSYWRKPQIDDEPDTTQSEINAYFTQILHTVEDTIKSNKITDINRALKIGQEALKDSQLVDAIIGGWDNNNPLLRRLSARMAQFVHSLFDNPVK